MFKKKTTPVREYMKEKNVNPKKLDIDTFGEIMDDFLTGYDCAVLLRSAPGSQDVTYQENMGVGPVGMLFFLLKAMRPTVKQIAELAGGFENEKLADTIAAMVRDDVLEGLQEAKKRDADA